MVASAISPSKRRMVILAEGSFSTLGSKTANGAIRYIPEQVVGVIDSTKAGKTAQEILGFGGNIPVFRNLEEALSHKPNTLLIGIAPTGGRLPQEWRDILRRSIAHGLHVISGLHTFISDDAELRTMAQGRGVAIDDLRKVPPEYEEEATCKDHSDNRNRL